MKAKVKKLISIIFFCASLCLCIHCGSGSRDTAENTPPRAFDQQITTAENTACTLILEASDNEKDPLSYHIIETPEHGTLLKITENTYEYQPGQDYIGEDGLVFIATDITDESNQARITIQVGPVNKPPVAQDIPDLSVDSNTSLEIILTATDPDGEDSALEYEILSQPLHGILTPDPVTGDTGNTWTYTPETDFSGSDSFTFRAFDGENHSSSATVSISVLNGMPVAVAPSGLTTEEDTTLNITLEGIDPENNTLTYHIPEGQGPSHGTVALQTGEQEGSPAVQYMPELNYNGTDSFYFYVEDIYGAQSIPVQVIITVTPAGDIPEACTQTILVNENETVHITLSGIEPDEQDLTYTISTLPAHGSVTSTATSDGPEWDYTPATDYRGKDQLTFYVTDTDGNNSEPVQIRLYVKAGNVHYVRHDAEAGGDGTFWDRAFTHPQQAIDAAQPGDEIWVASGTYTEISGSAYVISLKADIDIAGGFNIDPATENYAFYRSQNDPSAYTTTLDGSAGSLHVCIGNDNTEIKGFTVTGGEASGQPDDIYGGAILLSSGSMNLTDCVFTDNSSTGNGGAIAVFNSGSLSVLRCTFRNNTAGSDAGAIYLDENCSAVINVNGKWNSPTHGKQKSPMDGK